MQNTKIRYGNDVGDILIAIDNAISAIEDAQEELRGMGEVQDDFEALCDVVDELTEKKAKYEDYMSGEYQAQIAEMARDYYREVM